MGRVLLRLLRWLLLGLVALTLIGAAALYLRYGGGQPYKDLSGPPLLVGDVLEVAATSPEPVGNVAVTADGRLFYTIHPESRPETVKLVEWKDGAPVPYPSAAAQRMLDTPLGIAVDRQGWLWVIDHGTHGFRTPRLLAFDLATGEIAHDHRFAGEVAPRGSFLQDLQVDSTSETVYIADVSFFGKRPALVVYDVVTGQARRALEGHFSVVPQDWVIRNPTKEMVFLGGLIVLKPGIDGIAISTDDQWLTYGAMAHSSLFRVATSDLKSSSIDEVTLASRVQRLGDKPLNDGLSADLEGNVYITDVEHNAVARWTADGELETVVRDPRLRWPDALSFGPDGWLYVADSAIPDQMLRSKSHMQEAAPYVIYRFRPGTEGVPGQ